MTAARRTGLARHFGAALLAAGLIAVTGAGSTTNVAPSSTATNAAPRAVANAVATLTLSTGVAPLAARSAVRPATRPPVRRHTASRRPRAGAPDFDPPEVQAGERLFLETRFAQFFAAHSAGTNAPLSSGDPSIEILPTGDGNLPGPFAGMSMNCRNCHLVDDTSGAQTRTYADYSRQSLVPLREDGQTRTPRNSPSLVNANLPRSAAFALHFDGEFASLPDLVRGTLTGRNYGWLPAEAPLAVAHIARVVREDDGSDPVGQAFAGLPYRVLLAGVDPSIPAELVLPPQFRLDVGAASDDEVLLGVTRLISAYVESLTFANASPYDAFLAKNGLPASADPGESDLDYSRRLRAAVDALSRPLFVGPDDGELGEHDQDFAFGPEELTGLRIFLREPLAGTLAGDPRVLSTRTGNCIACHAAPNFTDFSFHNTGATQQEFDAAEGDGAFAALFIPDLDLRGARYDEFLPPTPQHPGASGAFRSTAVDLGVWNVFGNSDFPAPQAHLESFFGAPTAASVRAAIAHFKTPGLRDLGQSGPYLHTGRKRELEEVVELYVESSRKQRDGRLRAGSPELAGIFLGEGDVEPLTAFLRSLNEDYN